MRTKPLAGAAARRAATRGRGRPRSWLVRALLVVVVGVGAAHGAPTEATAENWEELVLNGPTPALVGFFVPWCEHCKRFKPQFRALERAAAAHDGARLLEVDCEGANAGLCHEYDITGYPSVLAFNPPDEQRIEYRGTLNMESLEAWIKEGNLALGCTLETAHRCSPSELRGIDKLLQRDPEENASELRDHKARLREAQAAHENTKRELEDRLMAADDELKERKSEAIRKLLLLRSTM